MFNSTNNGGLFVDKQYAWWKQTQNLKNKQQFVFYDKYTTYNAFPISGCIRQHTISPNTHGYAITCIEPEQQNINTLISGSMLIKLVKCINKKIHNLTCFDQKCSKK